MQAAIAQQSINPDQVMAYLIISLVLVAGLCYVWILYLNPYLRAIRERRQQLQLATPSHTPPIERKERPQAQEQLTALLQAVPQPVEVAQVVPRASLVPQQVKRLLTDIPAEKRLNVLLASAPGDGKTTTLITMMLADMARGVHAVVCNPHFTYYNQEDQPIDLRPLAGQFDVAISYKDIYETLKSLQALIEQRKPLYQNNAELGATVVCYIDELPAINGESTNPEYAKACRQMIPAIVYEGRKYKVLVVLAAQSAQVSDLNFSGGVRECFALRLAGNVDTASWRALVGDKVEKVQVAKGTWYAGGTVAQGLLHINPATSYDVQEALQVASGKRKPETQVLALPQPVARLQPVVQVEQAQELAATVDAQPIAQQDDASVMRPREPHERAAELQAMTEWLDERDANDKPPSGRELARRLYRLRGGQRDDYKGDGPLYYQAMELKAVVLKLFADETPA